MSGVDLYFAVAGACPWARLSWASTSAPLSSPTPFRSALGQFCQGGRVADGGEVGVLSPVL